MAVSSVGSPKTLSTAKQEQQPAEEKQEGVNLSGLGGALAHLAVQPVPTGAMAVPAAAKVIGRAALGAVAVADTAIAFKTGFDDEASTKKKLLALTTAGASIATVAGVATGNPVAIATGLAALGAGLWRDRTE